MFAQLKHLFKRNQCDTAFWEELEESLLAADIGIELAENWLKQVRGLKTPEEVRAQLRALMRAELIDWQRTESATPYVILLVGVNGVGKTTAAAKLAHSFQRAGQKALLVAADTFRAAAADQLKTWGERLGIPVIAQAMGSDPAAVAFDGVAAAVARGADVAIVDTAGRLHTKTNLMEELKKIKRVMGKALPEAPHDIWLVLDATTGQNGLTQARDFHQALQLTGVILAKLDGTAKAGIIFQIQRQLNLPILYTGAGETADDLHHFDPTHFVREII